MLEFAFDHGALPATLMYRGYKKSTCTSINHVVCHGIPGDKPLKEGDIVNIDVTLILDGWHGDSSRMYAVGEIPRRAERLIEVTYDAMMRGIAVIKPGATTGDIGAAIQTFVEAQHMSVVRDFCGHGLGRLFHDEPNIVHVGRPGEGIVLRPGMFFTVEPMINLGRPHVKVLSDGWTAVTRDRSLSAQFEHTIGVTANRLSRSSPPRPRASTSRHTGPERAASHLHAERLQSTAPTARILARDGSVSSCHARRAMSASKRSERRPRRRPRRIISGIANGCASASSTPGPTPSPNTSCWSSCCSAPSRGATSNRSPRR